jgi:hypothetical protein
MHTKHVTPVVYSELTATTPVDERALRLRPALLAAGARACGSFGDYGVRRETRHVTRQAILGFMTWPQVTAADIHHSLRSSQVIGHASPLSAWATLACISDRRSLTRCAPLAPRPACVRRVLGR